MKLKDLLKIIHTIHWVVSSKIIDHKNHWYNWSEAIFNNEGVDALKSETLSLQMACLFNIYADICNIWFVMNIFFNHLAALGTLSKHCLNVRSVLILNPIPYVCHELGQKQKALKVQGILNLWQYECLWAPSTLNWGNTGNCLIWVMLKNFIV